MISSLTHDFDPTVVQQILDRLDNVETEQQVIVPWAIESGSRAWGFPSADSDYDCRFFFIRPQQHYLSPWRPRDVIETPLDGVLDVNGWDLIKAVQLATRGNATVAEWLRSPLIYRGDAAFAEDLLALYRDVVDVAAVRRHYYHLGRMQWDRSGAAHGGIVSLKKLFYAIRPAVTLNWMRHQGSAIPPMHLPTLLDETALAPAVVDAIHQLAAAKSVTRELGEGVTPDPIRTFVMDEFQRAADSPGSEPTFRAATRERAAAGFIDLLDRYAPA